MEPEYTEILALMNLPVEPTTQLSSIVRFFKRLCRVIRPKHGHCLDREPSKFI